MFLEFSIMGNGTDPEGNPLPKLKMTGRQSWTDKAQKYVVWKKHVVEAFMREVANDSGLGYVLPEDLKDFVDTVGEKPLVTGTEKVRMDLMIYWKDRRHGDPENIFGSIADALFKQDKYLAGSFDFCEKPVGHGFVEVRINL